MGLPWASLGSLLGLLGPLLGLWGPIFGTSRLPLVASWRLWAPLGCLLGSSWNPRNAPWASLGIILGSPRRLFRFSWAPMICPAAPRWTWIAPDGFRCTQITRSSLVTAASKNSWWLFWDHRCGNPDGPNTQGRPEAFGAKFSRSECPLLFCILCYGRAGGSGQDLLWRSKCILDPSIPLPPTHTH